MIAEGANAHEAPALIGSRRAHNAMGAADTACASDVVRSHVFNALDVPRTAG
jgi:hypothetical protein